LLQGDRVQLGAQLLSVPGTVEQALEHACSRLGRCADEGALRLQVELLTMALEDGCLGAGPAWLGVQEKPVVVEHDPGPRYQRDLVSLAEERVGEILRVEGPQVVEALADADQLD